MAQMFSTKNPPSRSAEHKVFEALKSADHTRNWKVFYSIHVPNSSGKPREIDFLVIIPEHFSVICLEVKGGSYSIRNGRWYASHNSNPLQNSPHDQARDTMFALKDRFPDEYFKYGSLSIGCAVAFSDASKPSSALPPHLAFSIWSADVQDPNKLYRKLKDIAKETSAGRHPKNRNQKRGANEYLVNMQHELELSDMSITKNRIFSSDLDTLREELLVLTSEQFHSLELVNDNDCCVIDGAAGTGKTVLAMELARQRCEENGEKVALICSNAYLSSRFERWAKTLSKNKGGSVVAGLLKDFPTDSQKQEKFDYLIIDEAQNLCDEKSRSLLAELLKGGLTDGRWAMFGDFAYQNIINPDMTEDGEDVLNQLKNIYPRMTLGRLKINCRNTYEIAAAVSMLIDIKTLPRSGVHGPLIQIEYFDSDSPKHLDNLLNDLVSDLKERNFYSRQIILLSGSSDDFNTEPPREYGGWRLLNVQETKGKKDLDREAVPDVSGDSSPKTLRYSDIYDFQGLESEVVILVLPLTKQQTEIGGGATLPDYEHLRRVLYTGMSRAKAILIIAAHKSYKEHLELEPRFEPTYKDHIESIT